MKIDGNYIKKWRTKNGWTQSDLAIYLDTQRCTIANWELGKHKISKLSIFKIKQSLE